LRRKDKIVSYLPFLCGGMYYLVITKLIAVLEPSFAGWQVISVLTWAVATIASNEGMIKLVNMFDTGDNEEEE
tara:strand:- start:1294 stop:1512 length:219 start_codon:yes stop_codon:yes gene_type:complete